MVYSRYWSEFTQQLYWILNCQYFLMSVRKVSQYWSGSIRLNLVIGYSEHFHAMKSNQVPEAVMLLASFLEEEKPSTLSHFDQSTSKYFNTHNRVHDGLVVSLEFRVCPSNTLVWHVTPQKHIKKNIKQTNKCGRFCKHFQWETRGAMHKLLWIMRQRRHMYEERRDGKGALLYLRQGGARLLTEVTTRKEGWGWVGWRTAQVWLVVWLWVEWGEESGWKAWRSTWHGHRQHGKARAYSTVDIRVVAA